VKSKIGEIETKELTLLRRKLMQIEAKFSRFYFSQIFQLIPEEIRPEGRRTFKAYDGLNNLFNLGYELLSWKVHKAIINAKLEPYLGFLHSEQFGKPSLVCDMMELYRFLIDDFLIKYCKQVGKNSLVTKYDTLSKKKIGKREFLNDHDTRKLMSNLDRFFESKVEIPRIRVGKMQTFETLINEEAFLLAKHLRNEREDWIPRIPTL
jgi:CRISPR-associated protein Cas1